MYSTAESESVSRVGIWRRVLAEFTGTFFLILSLVGAALFTSPTAGLLSIVFAVAFVMVAVGYAIGPISGAHLNPMVSLACAAAGRLAWRDVPFYVLAQTSGGVSAAALLYFAKLGAAEPAAISTFGEISNGWDSGSPLGFNVWAVATLETVLAVLLCWVVLSTTARGAWTAFAPFAIGMTLGLLHLILIPVSNAGLNPVRSLATAIFAGGLALSQLWLFSLLPLLGGLVGGFMYRWQSAQHHQLKHAKFAGHS